MKKAIVVGSGAGGATVARELQGKFQVTVLEAGNSFHPFTGDLKFIEKVKKTGLLFNERQIQWIFPTMKIGKTGDKMVLVKGIGQGGTTTLSAGNAVRQDQDLKAIGINLDAEFQELSREIPIYTDHQKKWHALTQEVYQYLPGYGPAASAHSQNDTARPLCRVREMCFRLFSRGQMGQPGFPEPGCRERR